MPAQLLLMKPILGGWSVCFGDGRELAAFHGIAARWRATRYLAGLTG